MTEFINSLLLWPFVVLAAFLILFAIGNAAVYDDYDEVCWYIHANKHRESYFKITIIAFLVSIYCLFFAESGDWLASTLSRLTSITDEYRLGVISAIGVLGIAILLGRCLYEIAYFGSRVKAFSLSDNIDRYISSVDEEESHELAMHALRSFVKDEPRLIMDRIVKAHNKSRKKKVKREAQRSSVVIPFPQENAINQ